MELDELMALLAPEEESERGPELTLDERVHAAALFLSLARMFIDGAVTINTMSRRSLVEGMITAASEITQHCEKFRARGGLSGTEDPE